ncbi:MAG: Ig-like domain-containing protein, partial [Bacteroidia bacterium]|nr:Ig-like domain-containing protein [Bacteroidia bacterium]
MLLAKRILSSLFLVFLLLATWQCAKRGSPTGGPKDTTPPVQISADPEEFTTEFEAKNIRLYFDEYIRLDNPQDQLIVSPPLKYLPLLSPQGGASKYVEVGIKDTLKENTTYTINFGQSIVDNNENNPAPFLSYVFSTGTYIDSLTLSGIVTDAFNRTPDTYISVMLYELDSAFTDSTIYQKPPTYITNTLDSLTTFTLQNLKEGSYKLVAVKDQGKNNLFDQDQDKIGFVEDTITLPTDSVYSLNLFREIRDFSMSQPSLVSGNKIIFGYTGGEENIEIQPLTVLPDSMKTLLVKEYERDTLNYWFSPPMPDSIVFEVKNDARDYIDTFTVKARELAADSLLLNPSHSRRINLEEEFQLLSNTPLIQADTTAISIMDQDSVLVAYNHILDTLNNRITLKFNKEPNSGYMVRVMPNAYTNFFGQRNDTLFY